MEENKDYLLKAKAYVAYAYGAAPPAASGYSGVSGSGWTIFEAGRLGTAVEHKVLTSKLANRRHWHARIRAVEGAIAFSPEDSHLTILLDETETVNAIRRGFIKTDRKPMAGYDVWSLVQKLISEKRIKLTADLAQPQDLQMLSLAARTYNAAIKTAGALGTAAIRASMEGPKATHGIGFADGDREVVPLLHHKPKHDPLDDY